MTRQSQKNEELYFARKASELLDESWSVEESPNEEEWPDLIVSNQNVKFGLEVRSIFKDESKTGSNTKGIESIRISRLKLLADTYYKKTSVPINLNIRGDMDKSEIDDIALFLANAVIQLKEQEKGERDKFGVKFYITRLPPSFENYSRWKNINDYVGWKSKLIQEILVNAVLAKESKLAKYRKNIPDMRLLLVLNTIKNSGRADLPEDFNNIKSEFNDIYVMLYPDRIYRLNCG
mgnify:CR=1 FL=1